MAIISESSISALQFRIQEEEFSSRLYKAASIWLNNNGFPGAAKLWAKYSDEELVHAQKACDFLLSLNIQPILEAIRKPDNEFKGLPNIVAISMRHEVLITEQCKQLASEAKENSDDMVYDLALWYLREQVEELDKIQNWIDQLKAFGDDKIALRLLDERMGVA